MINPESYTHAPALIQLASTPLAPSGASENWPIFLVTNERNVLKTRTILSERPVHELKSAVMGVSLMYLLNCAAWRGELCRGSPSIEYIVSVDISHRTGEFWRDVRPIIINHHSKEEISEKICQLVCEKAEQYYLENNLSGCSKKKLAERDCLAFQNEIARGDSWLSRDETTQRIRKFFLENRFFSIQADLCHLDHVQKISEALNNDGITLDTLYTANIGQYNWKIDSAIRHLARQEKPGTLLIEAPQMTQWVSCYVGETSSYI